MNTMRMALIAGRLLRRGMEVALLAGLTAGPVLAQGDVSVYATGLTNPIGIEIDARGWLWVAEQGTGNDDGRISIVTADGQVHPFLEGLRSMLVEGEYESAQHLHFVDGALWLAYGLGSETPESYLLRVDTTGFTPGDPPLDVDAAEAVDIGTFVLGEGFAQTSIYDFAVGPDGDLFLVDASANALIRRDAATGDLSVFDTFDPIPNPTPVGPPFMDPVPTSIVSVGDRFYVSTLSGFPFLDGMASVFEVDLEGNDAAFWDGLTLLVDLAVHPQNGSLLALQIGRFTLEEGFLPNAGSVLAVTDGQVKTQVTGLNRPAGMVFDADGNLFVTTLGDGEVLKVAADLVTAAGAPEGVPHAFSLHQNYPNPFNPATTVTYTLQRPAHVVLKVYDALGREVDTLVDAVQPAGVQAVVWGTPRHLGSGVYFYRLQAAGEVQSRKMLLVK